jgi:hypothetical protein
MMIVAVSPYHLTTREAPAMAALLLAERVVTILPAPLVDASREKAEAMASELPRFRKLLQSWEWLVPLWRSGVVCNSIKGQTPVQEAREACRVLGRDGRYAALAPLMRPELFDDEQHYLDAVSHDLNRAGPDPGITVPIHAGLDWFAVRCGLAVARPEPASIAQRAEMPMARKLLALAVPGLVRAGPETMLRARHALAGPLARWRRAVQQAAWPCVETAAEPTRAALDELGAATRAYAAEFAAMRDDVEDDADEIETVQGMLKLTVVSLPSDAVLSSSVSAMQRVAPMAMPVGGGLNRGREGIVREPGASLAIPRPYEGRRFAAIIVSVMGQPRLASAPMGRPIRGSER